MVRVISADSDGHSNGGSNPRRRTKPPYQSQGGSADKSYANALEDAAWPEAPPKAPNAARPPPGSPVSVRPMQDLLRAPSAVGRPPSSKGGNSGNGNKKSNDEDDDEDEDDAPSDLFARCLKNIHDEHERQLQELKDENSELKSRLDAVVGATWGMQEKVMAGEGREPDFGPLTLSVMPGGAGQKRKDWVIEEDALAVQNVDKQVHYRVRTSWLPIEAFTESTRHLLMNFSDRAARRSSGTLNEFNDQDLVEGGKGLCGRCCVMNPTGARRLKWEFFGIFLLFYDMIMIPITFFNPDDNFFLVGMDWLTLTYWTFDMIATSFTGYYSEGHLVMDPSKTMRNYFRGWFILDGIVVGPDLIISVTQLAGVGTGAEDSKGAGMAGLLRAFRLIRCLRLLRVAKLRRKISRMKDNISSESTLIIISAAQLIFTMIFLQHFLGPVYYMVGDLMRDQEEENWIDRHKMDKATLFYQYWYCFHWAMSTFTLGWSGVQVYNWAEAWFSLVVMQIGMVFFCLFIASLTNWIQQLQNTDGQVLKQLWLLRRYFKQQNVDPNLHFRVMRYLEYKTNAEANSVSIARIPILKMLSDNLHCELMFTVNYAPMMAHPLFEYAEGISKTLVYSLAGSVLSVKSYASQDVLFERGTVAAQMYVLETGQLNYSKAGWKQPAPLASQDWLCEMCLWVSWICRGDLQATTDCQIIQVDHLGFEQTMCADEAMWGTMSAYAEIFTESLNDIEVESLTDIFSGHYRVTTGETGRIEVGRFMKDAQKRVELGPQT